VSRSARNILQPLFFLLLTFIAALPVAARDVPALQGRVNDNAGLLSPRQAADRCIELVGPEQETFSPGNHVHRAVSKDDGITFRSQRSSQGELRIQRPPVLGEAGDGQSISRFHPALLHFAIP